MQRLLFSDNRTSIYLREGGAQIQALVFAKLVGKWGVSVPADMLGQFNKLEHKQ